MTSILPALYAQVEQSPDRLLYSFLDINGRPTESYSYAQFLRRTSEIAAFIQRRHALAPGDRVLLAYPPGVEMICAFFACVRLGLIPVPVYPPTGTGFRGAIAKLDFIARDCQAAAVLSTRAYQLSMHVNETRHRVTTLSLKRSAATTLPWIITTDADRGAASEVREAHSDILFLQYTSGSTSEPKGVIVTHDNILANCEAVV
jgi:acyl-CoA synthetase (AMP-forming)/AMP-acid ligase II